MSLDLELGARYHCIKVLSGERERDDRRLLFNFNQKVLVRRVDIVIVAFHAGLATPKPSVCSSIQCADDLLSFRKKCKDAQGTFEQLRNRGSYINPYPSF